MKIVFTQFGRLLAIVIMTGAANAQSPLGNNFTYQGRLRDSVGLVNDEALPMSLTLYDAAANGNQVAGPLSLNAAVFDGLFTVQPDFGAAAFNGEARWLEVVVNGVTLSPRQQISAAPYALHTRGLAVDASGNLSVGGDGQFEGDLRLGIGQEIKFADNGEIKSGDDNHRILFRRSENKMEFREFGDLVFSPGAASGQETAAVVMRSNGNVGIGTGTPQAALDVNGDAIFRGFVLDFRGADFRMARPSRGDGGRVIVHEGDGTTERMVLNFGNDFNDGVRIDGKTVLNGDVGIGTSSPAAKLHVAGNMKVDGANTLEFGAGVTGKEANAGKIGYQAFTSDALDIVGAGTGELHRKLKLWAEAGTQFTGPIIFPDGTQQATASGGGPWTDSGSNIHYAGGNVGIGTAAPTSKLHVAGNIQADDVSAQNISGNDVSAGVVTCNDIAALNSVYAVAPDASKYVYMSAAGGFADIKSIDAPLSINHDSGQNVFLCADGGRVGIGNVTPSARLDVRDDADDAIGIYSATTYGANAKAIYGASVFGYAGYFSGRVCVNGIGGSPAVEINAIPNVPALSTNGDVRVTGKLKVTNLPSGDYLPVKWNFFTGDFFSDTSSRRFKENITPLEDDFHKLLLAEAKTYTRPDAPERCEIGFIAEEFDELGLNRLVHYEQDGVTPVAINYEKISLYLTAIARQQDDRVRKLEAENVELRERLTRIEKAVLR